MKKLTTIAIAALAFAACTPKQAGYQVSGTVTDSTFNGNSVYLMDLGTGEAIDTAVIENNKFSFSGTLNEPMAARIILRRIVSDVLLTNSSNITAEGINKAGKFTITDNNGYNDKASQLMAESRKISEQARGEYDKMSNEGKSMDEIRQMMEVYIKQTKDLFNQTITENKDNILGAYAFSQVVNSYNNLDQLDSMVAEVKYSDKIAGIVAHKKQIESKEATKVGKMFVDFAGKNIDGSDAKLSDHVGKGKYVLADFWASWCGPCRGEIPNLVELQNKYGGDNFKVLGVNVWDRENEFKKALEEEKINYDQLYASDNKEATTLYGIQGIPQIILFGPDGTIVARDLRGEAMKEKVAEVMGK